MSNYVNQVCTREIGSVAFLFCGMSFSHLVLVNCSGNGTSTLYFLIKQAATIAIGSHECTFKKHI